MCQSEYGETPTILLHPVLDVNHPKLNGNGLSSPLEHKLSEDRGISALLNTLYPNTCFTTRAKKALSKYMLKE